MMETVNFKIIGDIKTKQRPRATVIGGHARVYTPKDTITYENYIRSEYQRQCEDMYFGSKPLTATIKAYYKAPETIKKYENYRELPCMCHQDLDNIAKLCLDSLNGIAYDDDKQIITLVCSKEYTDCEYEYVDISLTHIPMPTIQELKVNEKRAKLLKRFYQLEAKQTLTSAEKVRKEAILNELRIIDIGENNNE